MGQADLHVHSAWSDGMASVRQVMEYAEIRTALDVLAIADHDQVGGALEAVEWCAGRAGGRLQAVVATEISMAWGRHLLALFFQEPFPTTPFPRFHSFERTAAMVRDAGGVLVVPHPLSVVVPSVGARTLASLLRHAQAASSAGQTGVLQGLEICSGVVGGRRREARLRRLNDALWRLAPLGNSDAHHLSQIGSAFTRFTGRSSTDLHAALLQRTTEACWGPPSHVPPLSHLRQVWRSLVIKPAREVRQALRDRGRGK